MNGNDRETLQAILGYCSRIRDSIARYGTDYSAFIGDNDYFDSLSMKLFQIGELVNRSLSDEYKQETVESIDWYAISGIRNRFAHGYGSMDPRVIWDSALDDIPHLAEFCREQLG
jgi:uncharacterized protein with HEPN domain